MSSRTRRRRLPEQDAALAALLFAVDPAGLGGVVLRGMPGPARDGWLAGLRSLLPEATPWRKVPVNVGDDRLLGGMDFAATVSSGRPMFATGILEAADGGVVLLSMAERLRESAAAIVAGVIDSGTLRIERDGMTRVESCRFGVVALDEGIEDDEQVAESLADRLAFHIRLADLGAEGVHLGAWNSSDVAVARGRIGSVLAGDVVVDQLCRTAVAFGIPSARAELLALAAARAAAALVGKEAIGESEAALAARLVLPQRARCLPETADPEERNEPETSTDESQDDESSKASQSNAFPDEVLVDAVRAAIPPGLLESLQQAALRGRAPSSGGRGGPRTKSGLRGRPIGVQPAARHGAARLNVLATLKVAAPWQRLRQRAQASRAGAIAIRAEDLRVTRFRDRVETTTIFVVDASGSQAARRLAEVKGAIELLLGDCYVRRDEVALIAVRGNRAELLLSPTRALARARRTLTALPGGGGTPLANGIDSARELAEAVARRGRVPAVVLLTDGRANVARDATPGSGRAEQDAIAAAREFCAAGIRAMLVDTARRPKPRARALADAMAARYLPLPHADAATISATVRAGVT